VPVFYLVDMTYMNFLLALAGASNVIGRLHQHEPVHLHAESFLDAKRQFAERSDCHQAGWTGQGARPEPHDGGGHGQSYGFNDLRADEIARIKQILHRHGRCSFVIV
jgi:hypothetical protein